MLMFIMLLVLFYLFSHCLFNMDFFVYAVPPFCISNTMSTLTAIAYIVALYPLSLVAIIYLLKFTIEDFGCLTVCGGHFKDFLFVLEKLGYQGIYNQCFCYTVCVVVYRSHFHIC